MPRIFRKEFAIGLLRKKIQEIVEIIEGILPTIPFENHAAQKFSIGIVEGIFE